MGGFHALALTQDETLVATVGQEKRLTLWDLRDPLPITTTDLSNNSSSPDEALTVHESQVTFLKCSLTFYRHSCARKAIQLVSLCHIVVMAGGRLQRRAMGGYRRHRTTPQTVGNATGESARVLLCMLGSAAHACSPSTTFCFGELAAFLRPFRVLTWISFSFFRMIY